MSVRRVDFEDASLALLEAEAKRLRTSLSGLVNMLVEGSWTPPWRLQGRESPWTAPVAPPVEPQESPYLAPIEPLFSSLVHVAPARITSFTAVKDSPSLKEKTDISPSDTDFSAFWEAYPRKVDKKEAIKAWKSTAKARPPLPALLASLARQVEAEGWPSEFTPYPATWLRRERWLVEPVVRARPEPPLVYQPESSIVVTPEVVASWDKGPKTEEEAEAMFGERMREMQARIARMPERREVPS